MLKIAVVGATGLVGKAILEVLEASPLLGDFTPVFVASGRSKGNTILFSNRQYPLFTVEEALEHQPRIAIFSAGKEVSLLWAPQFAGISCYVIDNSSAWRMKDDIPLVVPEINASVIKASDYIIANPNCSTIQMVMALAPLHKSYGIRRIVVSTYQSVTGAGRKALEQLMGERNSGKAEKVFPHSIDMNLFPHGGYFLESGYTSEEEKLVDETHKILDAPQIGITATVVRVPVKGGHSEAVNVEFERDYDLDDVKQLLIEFPGIILRDDPANNEYPMPLLAEGKDEVFVGRLRRDFSRENALNLWIVSDNLRKGAATNAVQIAEYIVKMGYLNL